MAVLPPRKGISAPTVTNIPKAWNAEWFRKFITSFLNNLDARSALAVQGITVTGNQAVPATIGQSNTSSTVLAAIPNNNFLGNVSGVTASPVAVTATLVTEVLQTFTNTAQGVAPPSGGGTVNFLRADGAWAAPPGTVGSQGPAGPSGPAGPAIYLTVDEPEEAFIYLIQVGH